MNECGGRALDWTGLDWTGLDWTGLDWTTTDKEKKVSGGGRREFPASYICCICCYSNTFFTVFSLGRWNFLLPRNTSSTL